MEKRALPLTTNSIIVGIDVHKYMHTAVAMDVLGTELGTLDFGDDKLEDCVSWLTKLGSKDNLVVGLEDVSGYGLHLTSRLHQDGFILRHVPPVLTKRERKHSTHQEKSDHIDAKRVGKVILHQGEETLPVYPIVAEEDKTVRLIDLHLEEREILVRQRTGIKNQLHSLLHHYYGNDYRKGFKEIFSDKALDWYENDVTKLDRSSGADFGEQHYLGGAVFRLTQHLRIIKHHLAEIDKDLEKLSMSIPAITRLSDRLFGCSWLTGAKIMAEVKNINRFETEAKLARYGGFAPTKFESAGKGRLHTTRRGNRKLNEAVHIIALSQIGRRGPEYSKAYFKKKVEEGKSKLWALRSLKRYIIRRVYSILAVG